jgi:hypothetical protein
MSVVLPANVKTHIHSKSAHVHSQLMKEATINQQNTNNIVRLAMAKALDEIDIVEARAIDKVLQLPTTG